MPDPATNLAGVAYLDVLEYQVAEFHPLPDGEGAPTQVHLVLTIRQLPAPLIMRLKSARACDELTDALLEHREGVWGART